MENMPVKLKNIMGFVLLVSISLRRLFNYTNTYNKDLNQTFLIRNNSSHM